MSFIFQPSENNRLGEYLNENLRLPWTHFRAAVAFVKSSGTSHIEEALRVFTTNGDIEFIVGIDHRGTSYEGLESLLASVAPGGRIIVFHNRGPLTFHPKIFLFKSPDLADVVVGSGNLTAGGLYGNYEAGLRLQLDLANPDHLTTLQSIEEVLDHWSDATLGTARLLDLDLLARLLDLGVTPMEQVPGFRPNRVVEDDVGEAQEGDDFPFASRGEPRAPRLPGRRQPAPEPVQGIFDVVIHDPAPPPGPNIVDQPVAEPAHLLTFVMTLQQTDAGVGQTTAGTSQRSPEIFIPLAARNQHPDFWQWPNGFVEDDLTPGKLDRNNILIQFGGEVIEASLTYFPHRHDFRLRNSTLRNAGNVGDILRIERAADSEVIGYEYNVAIVPQGEAAYEENIELCQERVRNSLKLYGYN